MDWPSFVQPPPAPPAPPRVETYPRVLRQVPDGNDDMLVTFALPGLRRHTVRVPLSAWLAGDHFTVGAEVHKTLDSFLPASDADQLPAPPDDGDDIG